MEEGARPRNIADVPIDKRARRLSSDRMHAVCSSLSCSTWPEHDLVARPAQACGVVAKARDDRIDIRDVTAAQLEDVGPAWILSLHCALGEFVPRRLRSSPT
ncbi:MAG: hypothetical protein BGO16_03440 [Nitrobacter sp. 62-23]|nr:MAG: hypothetical protein BGO16_03440 [Nitrobacter sp. 62-23]